MNCQCKISENKLYHLLVVIISEAKQISLLVM